MDVDELDRLLKKFSEEEEVSVRRRLKKKKIKVWNPCTLEGRKDVTVLRSEDVKNWHIELFQPKVSERKGLLLGRGDGEVCVVVAAEIPDDLKIEHIFENRKVPGYVKEIVVKKGYLDEILS